MSAAMQKNAVQTGPFDMKQFERQQRQMLDMQKRFAAQANASGTLSARNFSIVSEAEEFNEQLMRSKIHFSDIIKRQDTWKAAMRQQIALQNSFNASFGQDAMGRTRTTLFTPQFTADLRNKRMEWAYMNQMLGSASDNMIKWGKNTQWAGRQLMVGFTYPLAIAAAGMGALAFQADKELTRIAKVYDTTATTIEGRTRELEEVRMSAMKIAADAAREYGMAMQDTLQITAELAATGQQGAELFKNTAEVARIQTLGEIERQDAIQGSISMQSVFRMSTDQLSESLNYFNAIENATSLSLKDLFQAIPRAAGPIAAAGGTYQDMALLLVAMKERGVEAAQGANAIKAAFTRLLRPSQQVRAEWEELTGTSITSIVEQGQGQLIPTLKAVGAAVEDLEPYQKQKAFAGLFGTYQVSRMIAMVEGLSDATGQVGRAMEVAEQSSSDWAAAADREMEQMQASASGRFTRAIESIKVELATLGKSFLPFATSVINIINSIVEAFNNLPSGIKTISLIALGLVGLAGPIIMMIGLFGNLTGQGLKVFKSLAELALPMKLLNAETRAAQLQALQQAAAMKKQEVAAYSLSKALTALGVRSKAATLMNIPTDAVASTHGYPVGQAAPPPTGYPETWVTRKNGRLQEGSRWITNKEKNALKAAQDAHLRMQESAIVTQRASETTSRNWGRIANYAGGAAFAAGMITSMFAGSNEAAQNFANMAMSAGLIATFLPWGKMASMAGKVGSAFTGASGVVGGLKAAIPVATKLFGPIGLLAGGALAAWKIYDATKKSREEYEGMANSVEDWAEIIGFEVADFGTIAKEGEVVVKSIAEMGKEYAKAQPVIAQQLRTMREQGKEQELINRAIQEGVKLRYQGASVEDARQAIQATLAAAGYKEYEIDAMLKFQNIDVMLENPEIMDQQIRNVIQESIDRVANGDFELSFFAKIGNVFNEGLNSAAEGFAKGSAEQFVKTFQATADDPQRQQEMWNSLVGKIDEQGEKVYANLSGAVKKALAEDGIDSWNELRTAMQNGDLDVLMGREDKRAIEEIIELERIYAETIYEGTTGLKASEASHRTLVGVRREVGATTLSLSSAEKEYNRALATRAQSGQKVTESEKLALLNGFRLAAGLDKATSSSQGFARSSKVVSDTLDDEVINLEDATAAIKNYQMTADDLVNGRKTVMQTAMDTVYDAMERDFEAGFDASVNAMEARHKSALDRLDSQAKAAEERFDARQEAMSKAQEKATKAFENRWESIQKSAEDRWDARIESEESAYDARIDQIEGLIDAEQEAETVRQRIFEAEQRRIQRLAQMYSTNIDFNMALNSGDLDEAARIQSNASADIEMWSNEDQREGQGTASEKRIQALEESVETINKERDARLEALRLMREAEMERLDARKEAEAEALQATQENERKALEAERKRHQEGIAATRQAMEERQRIEAESQRKRYESAKRAIDAEMAVQRASVPVTESAARDKVSTVEGIWSRHGSEFWPREGKRYGDLLGDGLNRGTAIATAEMNDTINWAQIANEAANLIAGTLGINKNQMVQWWKTGIFPGTKTRSGPTYMGGVLVGGQARHAGGPTWSQADRVGVPRSASLFPSEVPTVLQRGEFVVNKKATAEHLPLLRAINERRVDREGINIRHSGGEVGFKHSGGQVQAGGPGMLSLMAGAMMKSMLGGFIQAISDTNMNTIQNSGGMSADILGEGALSMILAGLRMQESSNNYRAQSRISSASGAYQYLRGTWGNYRGYREAYQAPPEIQDERAARDMLNAYRRYGSWEKAVASHFYPAWADDMSKWSRSPGPGNPTIWDYVMGVMSKAGFGGGLGGPFKSTGKWPPARRGTVSPNTRAAADYVRQRFGIRSIGLLGNRPNKSDHPMGKAADFMIPAWNSPEGIALGNSIAGFFVNNPNAFGTKYVIWRDKINSGSGWRPYVHPNGWSNNPTLQHRDHVHASFKHDGGLAMPQLFTGGKIKYDNTIANLHRGETVLTADLSKQLENGIGQFANGGGTTYNEWKITVNGTASDADKRTFKKIVQEVIDERENRNGRSRKVGA